MVRRERAAAVAFAAVVLGATAVPAKSRKVTARMPPPPCPPGMIEVLGDYCPKVEQACAKWMPPEKGSPPRCEEFEQTPACAAATVKRHFCIDRFEFPNERGKRPAVMKTWQEADAACRRRRKRLCRDSEWTLACEGPAMLPYPYGHTRDAAACNIDRPHLEVDPKALARRATRAAELSRLWQGEPSGARSACVSPFGVSDMTGNVDEWVVNERGKPFRSALKGGYWGRVRNACRPITTAHGETFPFYQTGFRCCADPAAP